MNRYDSEILIVGGGAAGMSAALAASSENGPSVTIIDVNPRLGGQIWRAELGKTKSQKAMKLIDAIEHGRINIVSNAQVFGQCGDRCLAVETRDRRVEFNYEKLIIATGARERFLPFPGWTLPNVFGAGGLQTLVKGGLSVESKKIVVAGTGPLLLAVADYLRSKGGKIVAIAEQASAAKIRRFAIGLGRTPSKISQAAGLRARLFGIPYLKDCWVTEGGGGDKLRSVTLMRNGKHSTVDCDLLACGFHLVPNVELASLLRCRVENGFVAVDKFQQTSVENIYCAGEPTGIGGVESSLIEGAIAGHAAAGNTVKSEELFRRRARIQRFSTSLSNAFALREELRSLAKDATIVCRCEDVVFGSLKRYDSWRQVKLQTRCGMGACQGRVCGSAAEFLFGWNVDAPRPPIFPVRMENL
ncbi:MAG TPA: FAD/NAD(P)-binding oxidoreductase [Pyrinomonadaceae bacterium]|nr:FAD/NAD(P)-binding oxidoreductase [Pyrinomonadaceae bacterium]